VKQDIIIDVEAVQHGTIGNRTYTRLCTGTSLDKISMLNILCEKTKQAMHWYDEQNFMLMQYTNRSFTSASIDDLVLAEPSPH